MSNVHKLELVQMGDGLRFDPDETLENAKGHGFVTLLVIGELPDGLPLLLGNCNAGEALILMERIKHSIVFGDD